MQVSPYSLLTEYISQEDQAFLAKSMDSTPSFTEELARQLKSGEWESLIPHCDRAAFPIQTLKLFNEGQITDMQWSTSQLFFNVYPQHPPETVRFIPLFPNKQQGLLATSMIRATMKIAFAALVDFRTRFIDVLQENRNIPEDKGTMYWSALQEKQFYTRLWKQYPPSEHCFMLVPDNIISYQDVLSVMDRISFIIGFNHLSRLKVNKRPVRMIPSRGMMQAMIESCTAYPLLPRIRLGLSPTEGMLKALKADSRDLYQSFAPLEHLTPSSADNNPANPAYGEVEIHDFYHQWLASHIPLSHRLLFIDFADAVQAFLDSHPTPFPVAEKFRDLIVDMEHFFYWKAGLPIEGETVFENSKGLKRFSHEILFWLTLGSKYNMALYKHGFHVTTLHLPFIQFLVHWILEHHLSLTEHSSSICGLMISQEDTPHKDQLFNFYNQIRTELAKLLNERLKNLISDDCEELINLKAYFKTAPNSFVKDYMYQTAAPHLPADRD